MIGGKCSYRSRQLRLSLYAATFGKTARLTTFEGIVSQLRSINKILATHFVSVCRLPRQSKDIAR
jgi:hypothetical protein